MKPALEYCIVGDVKDQARAYPYHSVPGLDEVRATYAATGEQPAGNATVPDQCTRRRSDPRLKITVLSPGACNDVNGPTFTVGGEGGGECGGEGGGAEGGEEPPPEGGEDPPGP